MSSPCRFGVASLEYRKNKHRLFSLFGRLWSRRSRCFMSASTRQVAVLGSTGSIGCNTLEVIESSEGKLAAVALSAHSSLKELRSQAETHTPRWIVAADNEKSRTFDWSSVSANTEVLFGPTAIETLASQPEVDIVVAAIVGSAGLRGSIAAVKAGKTLALANKETLVVAGPQVMKLAKENSVDILPVDSEHSAIFQALQCGGEKEINRVILTASGGPFRTASKEEMASVTVEQALAHPTWDMGPKITIDSATMMNKALEIIEARWLFDLPTDKIEVVVHPQSIIHSMVEFVDGSVIAQMSPPDMKLPIQYALTWPRRTTGPARRLDLTEAMSLEFEPPDFDRFPALQLGLEVAAAGGTSGAVFNAANEAAVAAFLNRELAFTEIVPACQSVLANHTFDSNPTVDDLMKIDAWARKEISRWVCT